jgi:hypothetical protein
MKIEPHTITSKLDSIYFILVFIPFALAIVLAGWMSEKDGVKRNPGAL